MRVNTVPTETFFPMTSVMSRAALFLCLMAGLPALLQAAPSMGTPPLSGPLAEAFQPVSPGSSLGPDRPLLRQPGTSPIGYRIAVDSSGVAVRQYVSGFPAGATIALGVDEYFDLQSQVCRHQVWADRVRSHFRSAALDKLSDDGGRFQWTVPFPESRTLRRIIGDEGPSLNLNGQRTIIVSGKSEWTEGDVQTAAGRPSKFPSLSMDQESRFTVEGKVGELINIRIQQDTESGWTTSSSTFGDQMANQIKLDYKGDEDAIFQEVQAGNTTLELPSTRFVGFRQQNKGLFGIRTKGRLGPLAFTAIASHEKSKSNRQSFRGGASVDTSVVRDYEYVRNTYFFLDEFYRANLPDYRTVTQGSQINPQDFVDPATLEVYVNDFNTDNDAEDLAKEGVAWAYPNEPDSMKEASGYVERGTWHRLDPDDDYTLVSELGYVILDRMVQDRHAVAVIYRTLDGDEYGSREEDQMVLKLLKARDARPEFPTWDLGWKNVYSIGSRYSSGKKFDADAVSINILREVPGKEPQTSQEGQAYIQILGLDERGQDSNSPPDRIVDSDYIGLDEWRGHLIFPDQTPFDPQHPRYSQLTDRVPEIYTSQQQRDLVEASQYLIEVASSSGEQRINLGGSLGGVKTETVEVTLNGNRLERGKDYTVDFVGNVTFMGALAQDVADPAADLEITYETEDVLGLGSQQKTLLGLRTEYEFWQGDGRLGTTMIYNNERSNERRVSVGAEPRRTVVWNLDLKAQRDAPVLTRMVDALPGVKTAAPSQVTLEAEIAQSRPNLNTKNVGYVDDFEGSERPITLSISRTKWNPASVPVGGRFDEANRTDLIWYNPYGGVARTDIWPGQEDQVEAQNKSADVLTLELGPELEQADSWNGVMSAFSSVNDFSQAKFLEIWVRGAEGELQIDLGSISEDVNGNGELDTEDEPYAGRTTGDGVVSKEEDIGIDGRDDPAELVYYVILDSLAEAGVADLVERRIQAGDIVDRMNTDKVDSLAAALKDEFLRVYGDTRSLEDPEGDNWHYDSGRDKHDYSRINGTQGNKYDQEAGDLPDTEDLNNDGVLNGRNDYFTYLIDLASDPHVPGTESEPALPQDQVWRLFRVPLYGNDVERVGNPDSTRVGFARLVLSGRPAAGEDTVRVQIARIEVVQNEWQEDDVVRLDRRYPVGGDEGLNVASIGTNESLVYEPPPGVEIKRKVGSRTYESEQSLVLAYKDLEPGHQMSATKVLSRTQNYTNYSRLRMYVHGESDDTSYADVDSSDIELFVRFGADSTNYYEYVSAVYPGWEGGRDGWPGNQVDIDLLQIAKLKAVLQSGRHDVIEAPLHYLVLDPGQAPVQPLTRLTPDELNELRLTGFDPVTVLQAEISDPHRRDGEPALYRARGNPSMQQIKQLTVGLRNRAAVNRYSGEVWLDEMRLDAARNDPGMAAYGRLNTRLADMGNVDGYLEWRQEDFRTATGGGGNSTDLTANLQTSFQLQEFLPGSWGFNIPVKAQFRRQRSLPRFGPNSDVELTGVEKDSLASEDSKDYYDLSLSRRQGNNWLLQWTLDQVNLRMSHSSQRRTSPVRPLDSREAQTMSFSYRMPVPNVSLGVLSWLPDFAPSGLREMEVRYLPSNLSYSMNANRSRTSSYRASDISQTSGFADTTFQESFQLNEDYSLKANPLPGTSADYNLRVARDLRKQFDPMALQFGTETGRRQKADVNLNLRFLPWLDQNYTFTANYEEDSDPTTRRGGAAIDSVSGFAVRTIDITTKNDLSARYSLKLPTLLKRIGAERAGRRTSRSRPGSATQGSRTAAEADRVSVGGRDQQERNGAEEPEEPGEPFFVRRVLAFASDYVEPLTATWRRNINTSAFNLLERPPLLYQFGVEDSLAVDRAGQGLTRQDAWSRTTTLEGGAGLRLPQGISAKAHYNDRQSRRSGSTKDRMRVTREERFPHLNLTWSRADRIPFVKRVINSAQVNAAYQHTTSNEGEGSLRPRDLLTRGHNTEVRLSWNGRWRWGPTTNIERVYSTGMEWDYELLTDDDGGTTRPPLRGSSEQTKTTTTFTVRHNLRPRSIPLFGRLESDIDMSLELGMESETRSTGTGDAERAPITATEGWKTESTVRYKFSENFRGEALIRVENNDNKLTDRTRKIREVRLSGTFFLR